MSGSVCRAGVYSWMDRNGSRCFAGGVSSANEWSVVPLVFLVRAGFWLMDGSYLRRERTFRKLCGDVALINPSYVSVFSVNVHSYLSVAGWKRGVFSSSVLMINVPVVVTDIAAASVLAL